MKSQARPLVTFLLPVYNGERYLPKALDSLLHQTFQDFEIVAIDDGSRDQTGTILRSYSDRGARISVYHQDNQGIIATLNRGLCLARGAYLARMDADDLSLPERLDTQIRYMEQHPETALIGSAYELIDDQGKPIYEERLPEDDTHIRWQLLFHNAIAHPASFFRMDLIRSHGLSYSPQAIHSEDYELWSRLLKYGFGHNLQEVLLKRRIHSSQVSLQNQEKVWKAATRVSLANILELGVDITLEEVEILRDWYYHFPQKFSGADLGLCNKLLQILYTFSHLPYLDRKQVRLIRGRWIGKILSALSIEDIPTKQLASMLGRMRPYDLFYLILYWQRKQKARGSTGQ